MTFKVKTIGWRKGLWFSYFKQKIGKKKLIVSDLILTLCAFIASYANWQTEIVTRGHTMQKGNGKDVLRNFKGIIQ